MLIPSAFMTCLLVATNASSMTAAPSQETSAIAVTAADDAAAVPSLRFDPAILDLGEMSVGQSKSGTVTVTNTSNTSIKVVKIVPACGCTKASEAPAGEIKPGASFVIDLTLDAGKRPGVELQRKVALHVDGVGIATFELKASVRKEIAHADDKPFVALIRLAPATTRATAERETAERAQDAAILSIDAALSKAGAKDGIRMKLHRESGALFVHGTALQIEVAERAMNEHTVRN